MSGIASSLRIALATGLAGVALGCSTTTARIAPDSLLMANRLAVPVHFQARSGLCGVAAVGMVADYYGRPLDDAAMAALTDLGDKQGGTSGTDLKDALERGGYSVSIFRADDAGGISDPTTHLAKGRPVIAMLFAHPARHFVVLTGVAGRDRNFLVNDPAAGPLVVNRDHFRRAWAPANGFALLAVPKQRATPHFPQPAKEER